MEKLEVLVWLRRATTCAKTKTTHDEKIPHRHFYKCPSCKNEFCSRCAQHVTAKGLDCPYCNKTLSRLSDCIPPQLSVCTNQIPAGQ